MCSLKCTWVEACRLFTSHAAMLTKLQYTCTSTVFLCAKMLFYIFYDLTFHMHAQLNLSHNQLQELHLHYLCLPGLEKLSLSHNAITVIHTDKKVLERITYLNLSHNRLSVLNWLHAFVGLSVLNVAYNILSQRLDLDKLTQLRKLNTLTLAGWSRNKSN